MHKEIYAIAKHYGDDCKNCEEVCCANMALDISREEQKRIAKELKMEGAEFRKKHTVLFRNMFKGLEMKAMSREASEQYNKNPRLLKFEEIDPKETNLSKEQIKRLTEFGKGRDLKILICPFYNRETHMCKIHNARPQACYLYPFNYSIEPGQIDFRKVNACLLSTNFLKRLLEFMNKVNLPAEPLKEALDDKEYRNHFHVPAMLVSTYIISECEKLKIKLEDENLKKLKKRIIMEAGTLKE
jgi:Fe-S-cluster containining protein